MVPEKKSKRGGARRKADPDKGLANRYTIRLYEKELDYLKREYGSVSIALRTLLPENFWGAENQERT